MSGKERIGIYGGTFSPMHCGHVRAALAFVREMSLDKLYIVPTSLPNRKEILTSVTDADRLEMARLAFGECEEYRSGRIVVSDSEMARQDKNYTVHTLESFSAPKRQLYMLVGTDMFLILDKWYRAGDIFALADIVLMRRERGSTDLINEKMSEYREWYAARISVIDEEPIVVSSTQIRERIGSGVPCDGLIPYSVEQYIKDNDLYR